MNEDVNQNSPASPPGTLEVSVAANSGMASDAVAKTTDEHPGEQRYPHRGRRLIGPRRKAALVLGLSAVGLLTLVCVSILFYRWVTVEPSSAMVAVTGHPSWVGATVTVSGPKMKEDLSARYEPGQPMLLRFHVPPGAYSVRVERNGKLIESRSTPPERNLTSGSIWWPFKFPETLPSKE